MWVDAPTICVIGEHESTWGWSFVTSTGNVPSSICYLKQFNWFCCLWSHCLRDLLSQLQFLLLGRQLDSPPSIEASSLAMSTKWASNPLSLSLHEVCTGTLVIMDGVWAYEDPCSLFRMLCNTFFYRWNKISWGCNICLFGLQHFFPLFGVWFEHVCESHDRVASYPTKAEDHFPRPIKWSLNSLEVVEYFLVRSWPNWSNVKKKTQRLGKVKRLQRWDISLACEAMSPSRRPQQLLHFSRLLFSSLLSLNRFLFSSYHHYETCLPTLPINKLSRTSKNLLSSSLISWILSTRSTLLACPLQTQLIHLHRCVMLTWF